MTSYFIPSNITTIVVSTGTTRSVVMLPAASTLPGRIVNVKTSGFLNAANFYVSATRISTIGVDTIDGVVASTGLTTYALVSTPNTCVTLASDGISRWMVLGNDALPPLSNSYFVPTDITGLRMWLDAADINSFTLSTNSTIARWQNKAPTFTSTFARPGVNGLLGGTNNSQSGTLGQTSLFGKPTVFFPVTSEMFISSSLANGTNSLFTVIRYLSGLNTTYPSSLIFGNIAVRDVFTTNVIYNVPSTQFEYGAVRSTFGVTNAKFLVYTTTEDPLNKPLLLSFVTNNTAVNNRAAYYGAPAELIFSSNSATTTTLSNYFINNHMYSTSMEVAEMLVYNTTLSKNDQQRVEGYLAWKWGLNYDYLYPGHPFKFVTPLN